ncbi:MAG: glycoside hydrolase family 127 protein [Verrucomicrobia bacterium]|mgnify:FL=1|jgi:hypothetical protein|nr:glycoside hydrolase family 127 protein [Verrucomicrobiota bacterium]OQC64327.1 MAG: hypothetical protein BWX48_02821 [Verrucomicrobia bacterium ADurb.Bin006]MDI9382584.1 glycoside hydrolase family 127 protein [Verrucomicrobiota bacterium]NMD21226.1 hypothetical protein [Verrucomicrobiota bacterium]HNU98989.1 glycoside hydrolase family 127 protein [Verrucomicrobiota bacterium]
MPKSPIQRRTFLARVSLGTATLAAAPLSRVGIAAPSSAKGAAASGLAEPAFRPLPLGSIEPAGWLRRQLQLQANGLSGHLDEFWPDVAQSQWFGGKAEGWERAPYWLDGLIPLAWTLGDEGLQAKARRRVKQILDGQRPDGWYAPYPVDASAKAYDLWAILLVNKVLVQYHEATGDDAVLRAVVSNLKAVHGVLDRSPLFNWGRFRWFEGLIAAYYVYEQTGETWLLDLARKLRAQGFDYKSFFEGEDVLSPTPRRGLWTWEKHVVNTGMALKAHTLAWRLSRDEDDRGHTQRMLRILDRCHGQVNGMFSGDECLAGRSPTQGTELCAVVEALYSLELALALTGDPALGDRLERIAFNALPATFTPDMWAHQYVQQANQVQCMINPEHMWSTNGPESNIYGLEPNYGCCLANMHQGWPKFAAHLWMRMPDGGLAAVAYAPSTARFTVRGQPVRVTLEGDYPFRETVRLVVSTEQPARFPLALRVPAWAENPTVRVGAGPAKRLKAGSFHRLNQEWKGSVAIELRFPMPVRATRRYNQAVALERGPLVYALKLGETWTRVNADKPHRDLPHGDFEVRPSTPWNYGLVVDEGRPETSVAFEERPVGDKPFSPEGAGVIAKVKGRRLPGWQLERGWAQEVRPELQSSKEPIEELTLVPYGCTNIRVTEFPRLQVPGTM